MAQQFSSILVFFQTFSLIDKIKDKTLSRGYSKFSVFAQYDVLWYRMFELSAIHLSIYMFIVHTCLSNPAMLHEKEVNIIHKIKIKYQN